MYVACPLQNLVQRLGFGAPLSPRILAHQGCRAWKTAPDLSVLGTKQALPSTSSIAQLGSIVWARVQVPARADLSVQTLSGGDRPDSEEVNKQTFPTTVGGLVGLNRPAVNALSELR